MVKRKKDDFFNYVSRILQNSMLTGIPQIASAGNWQKRIVRTLVFFMCLGGCIYQSMSFMKIYWEYDVVMDVKVENPVYDVRPSVTICSNMGFKVQEFCKRKHEKEIRKISKEKKAYCSEIKQAPDFVDLCECLPRLCDMYGNPKNLSDMIYGDIHALPRDELLKWLLTPEEIISECYDMKMTDKREEVCSDHYYLRAGCQHFNDYPEACVTVNSLIGRPNHTLEKIFTDSRIDFILKTHEDNYAIETRHPLMAVSVHSPYTILNPFLDGFVMEQSKNYRLRLKKVVKKLLPPPYKTNCMDYRGLWHSRGGHGPTNLRECMQECQNSLSLKVYGCLLQDLYYPSDAMRCPARLFDETLYAKARPCAENCRPACQEEYYTVETTFWKDQLMTCRENLINKRRDECAFGVLLNGMETTTYYYSPKYEDIETFSYLGGYVGMWLGISLVAMFDFFETVVIMLKFPLRRWARYKKKKRKIGKTNIELSEIETEEDEET